MDSVKVAVGVCFFVAAVSIGFGMLFAGLGASGTGLQAQALQVIGWSAILEGGVFLALGFGTARGSSLCALGAAVLYTLDSALILLMWLNPCAVVFRAVLVVLLWKGAFDVRTSAPLTGPVLPVDLGSLGRSPGQQRRAESRPVRPPAWTEPVPAGRFRATRRQGTAGNDPHKVCPNCRRTYGLGDQRCPDCNVVLFVG